MESFISKEKEEELENEYFMFRSLFNHVLKHEFEIESYKDAIMEIYMNLKDVYDYECLTLSEIFRCLTEFRLPDKLIKIIQP